MSHQLVKEEENEVEGLSRAEMSHQLVKEEENEVEGFSEVPDAAEDEQSHLYTLNSLTQHLSSPGNTSQMTSSLVTSEPPISVSSTVHQPLHGSEDRGLHEDKSNTTCDPAMLTNTDLPRTRYDHSKTSLDENNNGKPTEIFPNMPWLPPVGPSAGHNGFGMRMPYYSPYYPYSAPLYPYGVPPGYFPEVLPPTRAVSPYIRHAQYGPGHPYLDPGLMSRYPGAYMSQAGATRHRRPYGTPCMSAAYMPYSCPQPPKPLRALKQQPTNKCRHRNMTSLLVDGRQLNYNWPPPQVCMPQSVETKESEASDVGAETYSEHSQTQLPAAITVVSSTAECRPLIEVARVAPVHTDDEMTTEQRMEQIHGMCVTPLPVSHAPSATPLVDSSKQRGSKLTKPIAKATYDMLQEAMKDKPDKAVKIAKTLFSKRMLTLYGWLYPSTAKRDIKTSIDKLWDRLPATEKEFYLSQAEGRFGSRSTGVMVNPQLAALPGLPDDLRFSPNLSRRGQDNHVSHIETEDAVRHLLASDVTSVRDTDTSEMKRKRQLPVDSQAKRAKTHSGTKDLAKKRPYRNHVLRSTRSSQLDDITNDILDHVKPQSPLHDAFPLGLQLLAEVASQRCYEASEEPLVSYACHEIYAEHEVVLSQSGTELTDSDLAGLGGLDMLGLIADSKMEMIRQQLDSTNKQYDNKWYFPSTTQHVYASSDVLR